MADLAFNLRASMISVLLLGTSAAARRPATVGDAVRTLSALVASAVDGVVRDVQLVASGPEPALSAVAEHAGCGFVAGRDLAEALAAAIPNTRSSHVLVVQSGLSFGRALTDEMAGTDARHGGWIGHGIALKAVESGPLGRVLPRFAPTVGVLTTRDRLAELHPASATALWRGLKPARLFKTRAWTGVG